MERSLSRLNVTCAFGENKIYFLLISMLGYLNSLCYGKMH